MISHDSTKITYRVNALQAFFICQVGGLVVLWILLGLVLLLEPDVQAFDFERHAILTSTFALLCGLVVWAWAMFEWRNKVGLVGRVCVMICSVIVLMGFQRLLNDLFRVDLWHVRVIAWSPYLVRDQLHLGDLRDPRSLDFMVMLLACMGFIVVMDLLIRSRTAVQVWWLGLILTLCLNFYIVATVNYPYLTMMWSSEIPSLYEYEDRPGTLVYLRAVDYGGLVTDVKYISSVLAKGLYRSSFLIILWCLTWVMLALRKWESPESELPDIPDAELTA